MKSYTDINQSKKLTEFLPHESADMCYLLPYEDEDKPLLEQGGFGSTPCWSLVALLGILPTIDDEFEPQLHRSLDKYRCTYEGEEDSSGLWRVADNPVDACYEMIIKLNELNLL